jgi:hypothetical protein
MALEAGMQHSMPHLCHPSATMAAALEDSRRSPLDTAAQRVSIVTPGPHDSPQYEA